MKINLFKKSFILLTTLSLLTGCMPKTEIAMVETQKYLKSEKQFEKDIVKYNVDPETFALEIELKDNKTLPISLPMGNRKIEHFSKDETQTKWSYPDEKIDVSIKPKEGYLEVNIDSNSKDDNAFQWPKIEGDSYYLPIGEGKKIPSEDSVWVQYLSGQEFDVLEQLSMPFWASSQGDYAVLFIMENPFRTALNFDKSDTVSFLLNHSYPQIDEYKGNSFRIYITENNPTDVAKIYRNYMIENEKFTSLDEKAKNNANIKKLYGAPHIYLAGEYTIASKDINWKEFRLFAESDTMKHILSLSKYAENGNEMETAIKEISKQDYVSQYQKNAICKYLSDVLKQEEFLNEKIFIKKDKYLETKSKTKSKDAALIMQLNKHALATNFPKVFNAADTWMKSETVDLIKDLKSSGIEQAWIGLHSWEQAFANTEFTKIAMDQGYLIATYDSYHSIHKPGEEKWITAEFKDKTLYDNATVSKKNGKKYSGFQNVGRKLNPTLALPSVKERVNTILDTSAQFNSWFIDCDATGEIYDDYSPQHLTTMQQDLEARLERMKYISDNHDMVIGSEGGHDFAAETIAFAHGIELKSFSWIDDDMKSNKESKYYLGKYYSNTGGVPEHFAKRVPIKEKLYTIFVDTKYDIPLFKLVYNDSVITTYHWDWSSFKIIGATKDRMLREVIYNVPPLYHLDSSEWKIYKNDIIAHTKVWSEFSKQVITKEMTNFKDLENDGTVQMCQYGEDIKVVANFRDKVYQFENQKIPAKSVLIEIDGNSSIYTPIVQDKNI